jgi:hypothetical protein
MEAPVRAAGPRRHGQPESFDGSIHWQRIQGKGVRFLTLLSRAADRLILGDCDGHFPVEHLRTFEQLNAALDRIETPILVLDPLCLSDQAFDRLLTAVQFSAARVLFLASMNASSARRIVQAAERRIGDVIFTDGEDVAPLLAIKLIAANALPASAMVLHALSTEVAALPHPVSVHAMNLFSGTQVPQAVAQFARRMRVPRRSLHRELARVGLASASTLLAVARLARTWEHVGKTPATEASFIFDDFPSYRGLHTQYVRLVGLPPGRAAHEITVDEFAARLAQVSRRQQRHTSDSSD